MTWTTPDFEVRRLTHLEMIELGVHLRETDREEVRIMGHEPATAIVRGFQSGYAFGVVRHEDQRPVAAFGVTDKNAIWMLCREGLTSLESLAILRHTPLWVGHLKGLAEAPTLYNFVPVDHEATIRWLEATKCFEVRKEVCFPMGVTGTLHYLFYTKEAADV